MFESFSFMKKNNVFINQHAVLRLYIVEILSVILVIIMVLSDHVWRITTWRAELVFGFFFFQIQRCNEPVVKKQRNK